MNADMKEIVINGVSYAPKSEATAGAYLAAAMIAMALMVITF